MARGWGVRVSVCHPPRVPPRLLGGGCECMRVRARAVLGGAWGENTGAGVVSFFFYVALTLTCFCALRPRRPLLHFCTRDAGPPRVPGCSRGGGRPARRGERREESGPRVCLSRGGRFAFVAGRRTVAAAQPRRAVCVHHCDRRNGVCVKQGRGQSEGATTRAWAFFGRWGHEKHSSLPAPRPCACSAQQQQTAHAHHPLPHTHQLAAASTFDAAATTAVRAAPPAAASGRAGFATNSHDVFNTVRWSVCVCGRE